MAKEFLSQKGVEFTEYNVANDAAKLKEMMDKSGQLGVPVIVVDDQVLVGYDPDELEKMLA
jgi:glutaredoxin 3